MGDGAGIHQETIHIERDFWADGGGSLACGGLLELSMCAVHLSFNLRVNVIG